MRMQETQGGRSETLDLPICVKCSTNKLKLVPQRQIKALQPLWNKL